MQTELENAIVSLSARFSKYDWTYRDVRTEDGRLEKIFHWFGPPEEEVMVCVLSEDTVNEQFHRHGFFFVNYAYRQSYEAESEKSGKRIEIREGECYIGQPFSGYALHCNKPREQVIIGVLIQKQTFYKTFLPLIAGDSDLFRFFVDSRKNEFADEFIHIDLSAVHAVRSILEMMVIEYARANSSQNILKPLAVSLLMYIARSYREKNGTAEPENLSDAILRFMQSKMDAVSLSQIAEHFGYHPNYISTLLHKEKGKTFSRLLLELRMERAAMLIAETTLSLEDISALLGWSEPSNFYKAYRAFYGKSPRQKA